MVTRFVPGGYQPEHDYTAEPTAAKVRRAVEGLGDLMDDYEFHHPQELSEENLDEVRDALDGHGIYAIATGTHLDPRFGKGGLSSPDDATRDAALDGRPAAADFAADVGAQLIVWPGVEGYNYPVPDAVRRVVGALHRRPRRDRRRGAASAGSSSSSSTRTRSRR